MTEAIDTLRAQLSAMDGAGDGTFMTVQTGQLRALFAEIDARKADAERWRYARRYILWDRRGPALPCGLTKVNPQDADEGIDAALLAAQQQKTGGA